MPDFTLAIPGLLQTFAPEIRSEAERLVEDDAVLSLDRDEAETVGEVALDDRTYGVRWVKTAEGWKGQTDAEGELATLVLCTLLVAAGRRVDAPSEADLDVAEEDFQAWLERDLKRKLTEGELAYIDKVDRRFRRVRQVGQIFDQDMVRLHSRWVIATMEPLEIWPEVPRSLREFWGYVALALNERGLMVPRFMLGAADLGKVKQRVQKWRREMEVPRWRERIRRVARGLGGGEDFEAFADQQMEPGVALRLMVSPVEMRLQSATRESPFFQSVAAAAVEALAGRLDEGDLVLPAAEALLLRWCADHLQQHGVGSMRFDEAEAGKLLVRLVCQKGLEGLLVVADEAELRLSGEPLVWRTQVDEERRVLRFWLEDQAAAERAELPLRVIGLEDGRWFYLSPSGLHLGPLWFADGNRMETEVEVPLSALESADGIRFLERLKIELPDWLAQRVVREDLQVRVKAFCAARSPLSSAEYAVLRMDAVDGRGRVVERMRGVAWDEVGAGEVSEAATEDEVVEADSSAEEEKEGSFVLYDRGHLAGALDLLEGMRAVFDPEQQGYRVRITKKFPDWFHEWSSSLPPGYVLEADEKLQSILADPLIARVKLEARETDSIDWFDLRVLFEVEGTELSAAEIRRLVAAKGGFVRLADGSWKRVELSLDEEQARMMEQMGLALEDFGDTSHRLHWRQLAGEEGEALVSPKAWKMVARRLATAEMDERVEVPDGLHLTLRPYQEEGFRFLCYLTLNRFGGILADDMGLGKTVQSIAWILWLRQRLPDGERVPPALVICPKSVLDVWGAELAKAAPDLKVKLVRERDDLDVLFLRANLDVLVINYSQLRNAVDWLKVERFLAVILDEGQHIKNPDSLAARAARQLQAGNRLVLTGTPLENRLLDLWSLMTFATPGALGDKSYFQKHFDRRKDGRASARLAARLRPFMLRRTKGQVAKDLPPRSEESLLCSMSEAQQQVYQQELARAQQMVVAASTLDGFNKNRFAILQALTRLRQICCHPGLVKAAVSDEDSAKLVATLELIEELHAEGHKVLLFSQFVRMLEILRERLVELEIPHHWLTGATQNRAEVVRAFQEDQAASVFLLSLKAGGSGLNLTAASYVILYDPWWNPAVEAQAIDRAHRIGQTQPVMAYRMITRGTIEEKILTLQQKKQMMADHLFEGDAFARTLDSNDIAFLFDLEQKEDEWQRELRGE